MNICFGGDVFLGGDHLGVDARRSIDVAAFRQADLRIVNLEQPMSDAEFVADKSVLYTRSDSLVQLQQMGVDGVGLANNHVHDKGLEAIEETISHLRDAGIRATGAGANIAEAATPIQLAANLMLFSYCDFGRPYLQDVAVATADSPGVSPLRRERILADLDGMKPGSKAVLSFHWGREHVWFPPADDIALAMELLGDERVALIVGSHPHRIQGVLRHKGKRAYMCMGNLLFPNFRMVPPIRLAGPEDPWVGAAVTRRYHHVYGPTYKKWQWRNRMSILVQFESRDGSASHMFVAQDDDVPRVRPVGTLKTAMAGLAFSGLSLLYRLPKPLYWAVSSVANRASMALWRLGVVAFFIRQLGVRRSFRIAIGKVTGSHAGDQA